MPPRDRLIALRSHLRRRLLNHCTLLWVTVSAGSAGAQVRFSAIDEIVNHAMREHLLPGAVVIVGHNGGVVYRRSFGMRSLEPTRE